MIAVKPLSASKRHRLKNHWIAKSQYQIISLTLRWVRNVRRNTLNLNESCRKHILVHQSPAHHHIRVALEAVMGECQAMLRYQLVLILIETTQHRLIIMEPFQVERKYTDGLP